MNAVPLPAICNNCGAVFPSAISGSVTISNVGAGPCPACGGMGTIPDGTYQQVAENVIRLLASSQKSIAQLQHLARTIEKARSEAQQPEKAIGRIKEEAPELQSIADALPKTRSELYGFLTVILMAVGAIIAGYAALSEKGLTEDEVQELVDKSIEKAYTEKGQKAEPHFAKPKIGRNEPCPCGSGKKYKHCCRMTI